MAREQLNGASYNWNAFPDRPQLAAALASRVADCLTRAIAERGTAVLAVSGGTTPAKFFAALSAMPIAWDKVIVTLVDERFVPASSPRSNAGLVAANLLQNAAKGARFVPLYHEASGIEDAAASDDAALRVRELANGGVDLVYDAVGGVTFELALSLVDRAAPLLGEHRCWPAR